MSLLFIISLIIYFIHINIISTRSLHMLQQNRYNRGYRYIKWIIKNYKDNFLNLNLLFFIFVFGIFSETLNNISSYLFIIITLFLTYVFVNERRKEKAKLPLKYTARIERLMVTNAIIYLIPI